jgi:membrane-associated phospholipid phosphatase
MLARHSRLGAPWTTPAAVFAVITVVGLAGPTRDAHAQERGLGSPPTFVINSRQELRAPAPPDQTTTAAELRELQSLIAQRDPTVSDQIARWSRGGSAYRWNRIAAAEMLARGVGTTMAARNMALFNVAIYDATISALDSKEHYRRVRPSVLEPNLRTALPVPSTSSYPSDDAAVAAAASDVLGYLFPDKADAFRAMAEEAARSKLHAGLSFPSDVEAGFALGHEVGARVVARGKADGADAKWTGSVPTTPGMWTGTDPASVMVGTWKTWVLPSGDALRPPPPPTFDSPQMRAELDELRAIQRTPAMLSAAWFWEWGAGGTRAWHFWNEQATRKVLEYGLSDKPYEAARVLALESVAFNDSAVACFDAKYAYWAMRPFMVDREFKALFPAPNHPSYPAAHACLSTAAGYTLAGLFPADAEELRGIAKQAADARMWAGIHFPSDVIAGQKIGAGVAERVLALTRPDGG